MRTTRIGRGHYAVRLGGRRVIVQRKTPSVWYIISGVTTEVIAKRIGLKAAHRKACSILRGQRREEAARAARSRPVMPSLI